MAISFTGAKKYKSRNGIKSGFSLKDPIPSSVHTYPLKYGTLFLEPTAAVGEKVLCGQKIADARHTEIIPVISSCSGVVTKITDHMLTVENDLLYNKTVFLPPVKGADELTSREILWLLREGAVFEARSAKPLHVMLSDKRVSDCIIVCCFDSDPYSSAPQAAAKGSAAKIVRALKTAIRVSGIAKAYVAVCDDTRKSFSDFKRELRFNSAVTPVLLKARYPQSRYDILVPTVTGSALTNAMILSPETLCNMADVLENGIPVMKKIVTLSGDDILDAQCYSVPIGASVMSLLESGGYTQTETVITGGVIDGMETTDLSAPVTHTLSAVSAFHHAENVPKFRRT